VARDAFSYDFAPGTMASDAVCFCRHEHVGGVTTLHGVMTIVALHTGVFGVIEICLNHPAIDQNRFGNGGRGVGDRFHFVAKRATVE